MQQIERELPFAPLVLAPDAQVITGRFPAPLRTYSPHPKPRSPLLATSPFGSRNVIALGAPRALQRSRSCRSMENSRPDKDGRRPPHRRKIFHPVRGIAAILCEQSGVRHGCQFVRRAVLAQRQSRSWRRGRGLSEPRSKSSFHFPASRRQMETNCPKAAVCSSDAVF